MIKKAIMLITLGLAAKTSFSQKLFFAKENYTDSIAFKKNIVVLAEQVIAAYEVSTKPNYYDDLFRLQVVAQQYNKVSQTLTQLAQVSFGDTVNTKALGFVFRTYSLTMLKDPQPLTFDRMFKSTFKTEYNALSSEGKTMAAAYYDKDVADLKAKLEKLKAKYAKKEQLDLDEGIELCRTYCSALCYGSTVALAKETMNGMNEDLYIVEDSILVRMPDGAQIALTVVRSKEVKQALPAVMLYNIYAMESHVDVCKEMVSRGYVGIVANTRGKRLSPDPLHPYEHDANDAYHIIDWISKQKWCDGQVGMYGGSYLGFSQWSAAKKLHPALKTIVPQVAVAPGIDFPLHNGIFMTYMLSWIKFVSNNKLTDYEVFDNMSRWDSVFTMWYNHGGRFDSLDEIEGKTDPIFDRWLSHPTYDKYWQSMIPQQEEFGKINIPILTTTGYWDADQVGCMHYYNEYHKYNKSDNLYMIIGPYDHAGAQGMPLQKLGNYSIDSVAYLSFTDVVFDWFDYTLKGKSKPKILKDKVNFEVMGANEWRHVPSLSQMSNDTLKFYFGNTELNDQYSLLSSQPNGAGYISQTVDLRVRNDIAKTMEEMMLGESYIDSTFSHGAHQLVFVSDPVKEPFAMAGPIEASITASINKKDMDVSFEIYELTADGKYFYLMSNYQRASLAKDPTQRNLLTEGKIETFQFNHDYMTCNQMEAGSRIVVVFGINKNFNWQVNYGTGKDVSEETILDAEVPMEIKWYNSSFIQVPILR